MAIDSESVIKEIKENINQLHERSQKTKQDLQVLEAIIDERNKHILQALENMKTNIQENNKKITELHQLATEGKISIKTLISIGSFVAGVAAFVYMLLGIVSQLPWTPK